MPLLTITGTGAFDIAEGTRLVNAIEQNGGDILHRCGGYARCTTCRVSFESGEPDEMTSAEHEKLIESKLLGEARLSCQILCNQDMSVTPLMTITSTGLPDPGSTPNAEITPTPVWQSKP